MKVLIIGGGIGGISASIGLRNAGIETEVFERADAVREIGAGISLWANAIKALDQLGVGAALRERGILNAKAGLRSWRGTVLSEISAQELQKRSGAPTLFVHRAELLQTLLDAHGVAGVRLNAACSGFEQDGAGVTARFANGTSARGDVLIGADGVKSVIRRQLFPESKPRYSGYTAWRGATVCDEAARVQVWGETWGRGARFGLIPLDGSRCCWWGTNNAPEGEPDGPNGRKSDVLAAFKDWHAPIRAVVESTPESAILRNDIHDIVPLKKWTVGRVTLLGDAAHATTPNLGQGACQAIEDAVVLAKSLNDAADPTAALKTYESKRRDHANKVIEVSLKFGRIGQWSNPFACELRDLLTRMTPARFQMGPLLQFVGHEV